MSADARALLADLRAAVGADALSTDADLCTHYGRDRTTLWAPDPLCVVRPASVEAVQAVVRLAQARCWPLVPSGGRTGLSGGAVAARREIVLSLERLNRVQAVDTVDRSITVEAGAITHAVQAAAADAGLFYPVDFASTGSSQIGGNLATNAGGINVIRYGMTRDWVRGLVVITGAGERLDLNQGLVKNNTGYDLRHLFIGSEGTLGVIVEATLALTTPPTDRGVMLLAVPDFAAILALLHAARAVLPLTAFEFVSAAGVQRVAQAADLPLPYATAAPFHVLIETEQLAERTEQLSALFEQWIEAGWVEDGVLSQSQADVRRLWRYREDVSSTLTRERPYKNDISVRVSRLPALIERIEALVARRYAGWEVIWYGHIGDGNLHLNILPPPDLDASTFVDRCTAASAEVAECVRALGGSISAEHGVGLLKKAILGASRSPLEIDLMRQLKAVFDPQGILNPGKIFDLQAGPTETQGAK